MKDIFRFLDQFWQKITARTYFIIFATVVVLLIVGITQFWVEDDTSACSSTQYLGRCYSIPRPLCETTLATTRSTCENLIKTFSKPGQLVGPIQRNCEQLKFDRILKYTRKSDSMCTERLNYLESWQKANPGF